MRTTIDVPDELLTRVKVLARQQGTTLRSLVIEGLHTVLKGRAHAIPFVLPDASFGEDGLVDGLAESDWSRLRDLSDGTGDS